MKELNETLDRIDKIILRKAKECEPDSYNEFKEKYFKLTFFERYKLFIAQERLWQMYPNCAINCIDCEYFKKCVLKGIPLCDC